VKNIAQVINLAICAY